MLANIGAGRANMGGSFACPECDEGIELTGLTPGREVICPSCATLVEVPYLPRVQARPKRWTLIAPERGRRGGRMSTRDRRRLRRGLALGTVVVVGLATWWAVGSIGSRARSDRERVLNELIAASDAARAAGDPGAAFREIEAAVIQARKVDPADSTRLADLVARRDDAARAEVKARLAGLGQLDPDRAVGEAQILADRTRRDRALAELADAVAAGVEAAIVRQTDAGRAHAHAALKAGRGAEAFQAARRAHDQAARLTDPATADPIRADARALIVAAIERSGVATAAPGDTFAATAWAEALAARGYLLMPADGPWAELLPAHAGYQATCKVVETSDELYLQSQNRSTRIDGQFVLTRRGQPVWQTRVFAQTRSPIPDLPVGLASRLATAPRRDPEIERRLRDDARTAFRIQADRNFRGIPGPTPTAPAAEPAASPRAS